MNVFVAAASGAIGLPLITELVRRGHSVTGMTRSDSGEQKLIACGASVARVSALDVSGVNEAIQKSKAEVIIDQLTALPKTPAEMASAAAGDRKLRLEGGGNLLRVAQANGVRRYIQQASGFFHRPGSGLADESVGMAIEASPRVAANARTYAELESRLLNATGIEGVVMRYGFFYGPNTWYNPDGAAADQVRRQEIPIIGRGEAVWSFVHIEDAALATASALTVKPGIYNIVDDDPFPVIRWLPEFAKWVNAPVPPHLTEDQVRQAVGEDAVYYGTKLRGASNQKAKNEFNFRPRRLEWLGR